MNVLRQQMIEDMQLKGLAERTQEAYVGAVHQLSQPFKKSPDHIRRGGIARIFFVLEE